MIHSKERSFALCVSVSFMYKGSRKKVPPLMARPLRGVGGGGVSKGRAIEKNFDGH